MTTTVDKIVEATPISSQLKTEEEIKKKPVQVQTQNLELVNNESNVEKNNESQNDRIKSNKITSEDDELKTKGLNPEATEFIYVPSNTKGTNDSSNGNNTVDNININESTIDTQTTQTKTKKQVTFDIPQLNQMKQQQILQQMAQIKQLQEIQKQMEIQQKQLQNQVQQQMQQHLLQQNKQQTSINTNIITQQLKQLEDSKLNKNSISTQTSPKINSTKNNNNNISNINLNNSNNNRNNRNNKSNNNVSSTRPLLNNNIRPLLHNSHIIKNNNNNNNNNNLAEFAPKISPLKTDAKQLEFNNETILQNLIKTQIEYFFTDYHLCSDTYLLARIHENKDNWVNLDIIIKSPRIKLLTTKRDRIINSLKTSNYLELSSDLQYIRRPNFKPKKQPKNRDLRRTVFVYGLNEQQYNENSIKLLFGTYGNIKRIHFETNLLDEERPDREVSEIIIKNKLRNSIQNLHSGDTEMKSNGSTTADLSQFKSCFVVFESQSQATKCVKGCMRGHLGIKAMHKYDYNKIRKKFKTAQLKNEPCEELSDLMSTSIKNELGVDRGTLYSSTSPPNFHLRQRNSQKSPYKANFRGKRYPLTPQRPLHSNRPRIHMSPVNSMRNKRGRGHISPDLGNNQRNKMHRQHLMQMTPDRSLFNRHKSPNNMLANRDMRQPNTSISPLSPSGITNQHLQQLKNSLMNNFNVVNNDNPNNIPNNTQHFSNHTSPQRPLNNRVNVGIHTLPQHQQQLPPQSPVAQVPNLNSISNLANLPNVLNQQNYDFFEAYFTDLFQNASTPSSSTSNQPTHINNNPQRNISSKLATQLLTTLKTQQQLAQMKLQQQQQHQQFQPTQQLPQNNNISQSVPTHNISSRGPDGSNGFDWRRNNNTNNLNNLNNTNNNSNSSLNSLSSPRVGNQNNQLKNVNQPMKVTNKS